MHVKTDIVNHFDFPINYVVAFNNKKLYLHIHDLIMHSIYTGYCPKHHTPYNQLLCISHFIHYPFIRPVTTVTNLIICVHKRQAMVLTQWTAQMYSVKYLRQSDFAHQNICITSVDLFELNKMYVGKYALVLCNMSLLGDQWFCYIPAA